MSVFPQERLIEALWPAGADEHVFAVLDGARDPRVHAMVTDSPLPHRCLYIGALPTPLARAAPWLVQLMRNASATRSLLTAAWGKSWGVMVRAPVTLPEMHRHLRRFLRVRDERGRTLLFRYYDPRVLRVYLPTCNEAELDQVFGPIESFHMEAEDPARLLSFRRADGELKTAESSYYQPLPWLKDYLRASR